MDLKEKEPQCDMRDFCKLIVDENFKKMSQIEAKYNENGALFFDEIASKQDSEQIKAILEHCQHADKIAVQIDTIFKEKQKNNNQLSENNCNTHVSPATTSQPEKGKLNPLLIAKLNGGRY